MFGKWCGELFGVAYWLCASSLLDRRRRDERRADFRSLALLRTVCTFTCGSALLTISTAFNALSLHAICTAAWVAIAAVIAFPFASLRTFGNLKWLGYVAVVSILVSIFTVVIAVGLADRPALAPPAPEPYDLGVRAFGSPSFAEGMSAVSSIFFAFTGTSSLCVHPSLQRASPVVVS